MRRASAAKLHVVTDPRQLMFIDTEGDDQGDDQFERSALEDIYLLSTDSEGLSGMLIENPPLEQSLKSRKVSQGNVISENRIQFNGLSTTVNKRARRKSSLRRAPAIHSEESMQRRAPIRNKSSTMPGFMERSSSDRQKAYRDGIKIAENRSGKKHVDTEEAKMKRRQKNGEHMYKTSASVPDSMLQFANEIHSVDRITPSEEITLGEKTQEAIRLQATHDKLVEKLGREPTDDEWCAASGKINMEAISQAIEEGLEAKNKLVESNLRMVQGVVNVYIRNGLCGQYNAGDLMQEGIMALIRAAEKFDPSRGFRFSTYAMYWIRSAVKRNQIYQSRVVTVPQRLFENHKRIIRVQQEMTDSLGRAPSKKEIGDEVGMSEVQVERCCSAMSQRCYSLDQTISNPLKPMNSANQKDTMYELIESRNDDNDYSKIKHVFLREDLIETLNRHLSDEEATLLLLRYGLMDSVPKNLKGGPLTIAELSRLVGMKPDKVRRMINKSLKQLKAVIGEEWNDFEQEFQQ